MKMKTLAALCMAALVAAPALPVSAQSTQAGSGLFERRGTEERVDRNQDRNDRIRVRDNRNWDRGDRDGRGRFENRGGYGYYNGVRGYRDRRPGYRQYNGFWFPSTAFSIGIIVNPDRGRNTVRLSQRHLEWCEDRYRSYRASDNSFQPNNGPRQQCISPYL